MSRKPHILESKNIAETRNPKRSSRFERGYGVLHSMLMNLMSLLKKNISLHNPIICFAILHTTSLANLVVEVGTRQSPDLIGPRLIRLIKKKKKTMITNVYNPCSHGCHDVISLIFSLSNSLRPHRVTHICVGKLTIIGSDNGFSPGRRQAII